MSSQTQVNQEQVEDSEAEAQAAEGQKKQQTPRNSGDAKQSSPEPITWGYCDDTSGGPHSFIGF